MTNSQIGTRRLRTAFSCSVVAFASAACGGTDASNITGVEAAGVSEPGSTVPGSGDPGAGPAADPVDSSASTSHLVVVTERESPETALQYLHVLDAWPDDGQLAYESSIELGAFVNVHTLGNAVFVHQPEDSSVRRLVIGPNGDVVDDQRMSFAAYGLTDSPGDMVYASEQRAYFLDEAAGQIITWNPSTLEIVSSTPIAEEALSRGNLAAQISRGVALDGQGFVSASWRDWDTLAYHDSAAVGVFDANEQPQLQIVEDQRCASNVTTPYDGGDGFVYFISDAALGFDALANPTRTEKTLCVLRMRPGAREFDPEFFVNLGAALNSPGFYAAHPMRDGKLLVNVWAPDVALDSVADPADSGWYWGSPPYFEFAIVDLATGTSTPVTDIARAAVQWSITLRVDDDTYVQTYREDAGSDVMRVDPDGSVTPLLTNPPGTDVQYLGRVGSVN